MSCFRVTGQPPSGSARLWWSFFWWLVCSSSSSISAWMKKQSGGGSQLHTCYTVENKKSQHVRYPSQENHCKSKLTRREDCYDDTLEIHSECTTYSYSLVSSVYTLTDVIHDQPNIEGPARCPLWLKLFSFSGTSTFLPSLFWKSPGRGGYWWEAEESGLWRACQMHFSLVPWESQTGYRRAAGILLAQSARQRSLPSCAAIHWQNTAELEEIQVILLKCWKEKPRHFVAYMQAVETWQNRISDGLKFQLVLFF